MCAFLCACTRPCGPKNAPLAGADRDAHGCIASAGYTYAAVLGKCVRLWEEGVQMLPVQKSKEGQAVLAAYVVLSKDGSEAELFAPEVTSLKMTRSFAASSGPRWSAPGWLLSRPVTGWELYEKGTLVYRAPNPPSEAH